MSGESTRALVRVTRSHTVDTLTFVVPSRTREPKTRERLSRPGCIIAPERQFHELGWYVIYPAHWFLSEYEDSTLRAKR